MSNRRIEMHEYQQIIYRLQQGQTLRTIAREGLAGRAKIGSIAKIAEEKGWLKAEAVIPDAIELAAIFNKGEKIVQRPKTQPFEELIRKWVGEEVQATTIYGHLVENHGFRGSYNSVQRHVKKLKGHAHKLTVPLTFQPGQAAQIDFGKGPDLYDQRTGKIESTWFFVMTLCWSRHQYVEIITHQDIETWLNCHQNAFNWFGGVVEKLIIDNPKCAITKACYYEPQLQRSYESFVQDYGAIISACPPREPKKKGRVESGVKYVKRNFLPLRQFKDIQDANVQLKNWILTTAGNRIHGSTFEKPWDRFTEIEANCLIKLPATAPEIAVWKKVTPYKNCHINHGQCFYSVPNALYSHELWLKQTATLVTIYKDQEMVAQHPRLFKKGEYSTNLEHLPDKAKAFLHKDANWCLAQSKQIGPYVIDVVDNFITHPTNDLLRAAQGIIQLSKKYGATRLNTACQRAIDFGSISYKTIKEILAKGLDESYQPNEIIEEISEVYQGKGSFQRPTSATIH